MPITSLQQLTTSKIFQTIDNIQARYEEEQQNKENKQLDFTRSPYHLITFLIVYAVLGPKERRLAHKNLKKNNHQIAKDELDKLVDIEIDWKKILTENADHPYSFEYSISANAESIKKSLQNQKKDKLSNALFAQNSVVKFDKNETMDTIKFASTIKQKGTWEKTFRQKDEWWIVPGFEIDDELKKFIEESPAKMMQYGNVFIDKKSNDDPIQVKLVLRAPSKEDKYSLKDTAKIAPGIYEAAFQGMENFLGLDRVDCIENTLHVEADLDKEGYSCVSKNEVAFSKENSAMAIEEAAEDPWNVMIAILELPLRFQDIETMVTLRNEDKNKLPSPKSERELKGSIKLKTKNGTSVHLLCHKTTHQECLGYAEENIHPTNHSLKHKGSQKPKTHMSLKEIRKHEQKIKKNQKKKKLIIQKQNDKEIEQIAIKIKKSIAHAKNDYPFLNNILLSDYSFKKAHTLFSKIKDEATFEIASEEFLKNYRNEWNTTSFRLNNGLKFLSGALLFPFILLVHIPAYLIVKTLSVFFEIKTPNILSKFTDACFKNKYPVAITEIKNQHLKLFKICKKREQDINVSKDEESKASPKTLP